MLAQLISRKFKASTIMESIIAALILLIGFSAGMVIYNRVVTSSWSEIRLRAGFDQQLLADSLSALGEAGDFQFQKALLRYEVSVTSEEKFPGQLRLQLKCFDATGKQVSGLQRIITKCDEN